MSDERTRPRRPGRPADPDPEAKRRLIEAAIELMSEEPWERVSARAVAQRAECDPALVTYYFGGRPGLIAAVAADAGARLGAALELAYTDDGTVTERLRAALSDPARVLSREPYLAQLFVDELIIHGHAETDAMLHDLARPYIARIQALLVDAATAGVLRDIDSAAAAYALGALPLFLHFLAPLFRRTFADTGAPVDTDALGDALTRILLGGIITDAESVAGERRAALLQESGDALPEVGAGP